MHPSFQTVIMAPTLFNKQLFINAHRNYIAACIYKLQPFATQDVRDDYCSEVVLKLLKVAGDIDFTHGYKRVLGYIAQVSNHHLQNHYKKMNLPKRIPEKSLVELNDWNDIMENDDKNIEEMKDKQLQLIFDCLKRANESEKRIITGLLKGLNYRDLGITRQAVSKCLKRFSKRILNSNKSIKL